MPEESKRQDEKIIKNTIIIKSNLLWVQIDDK